MADMATAGGPGSAIGPPSPALTAIQAAFERVRHGIVAVSSDGRVLAANLAARDTLGLASHETSGHHLSDLIARIGKQEDVAWFRKSVPQALAQGPTSKPLEHRLEHQDADRVTLWSLSAVPVPDAGTGIVVAEVGDVTTEQHERTEERLLKDLAFALGETDSLELGLNTALATICRTTGWSLAEAWVPSSSPTGEVRLVRAAVWAEPDRRLQQFIAQGTDFGFEVGEGLPGLAWQRREVVWDSPLGSSQLFTRASLAAQAGLRAAIALPVIARGDVVAVLSCYMNDVRSHHNQAALMAAAVAAQLGPLIRQKQAEEAHRNAEAHLTGTIAISTDAIISVDESLRITLFNWGAERIFGYTADEALGQPLEILLPEEVRPRHAGEIRAFAKSAQISRPMSQRGAISGRRKGGQIFPAEASISRYMTDGQWIFTVVLRDISDRRRTEEGLRFLAEVSALLGDLLHDPTVLQQAVERAVPTLGDMCVIDLIEGGHVVQAALAGLDPAMVNGLRAMREARPPNLAHRSPMIDAIHTRTTLLLPDGIEGWSGVTDRPDYRATFAQAGLQSMLVLPLIAHDRVLGAAGFFMARAGRQHDETYRALAEAFAVRVALAVDNASLYQRARQAVGARDETLAVVSHDLRNPLSAITMYMSTLRDGPPANPETIADLVQLVQESTDLMSRIIEDLMDVAHIDAGRLSLVRHPQPVAALFDRAEAMFRGAAEERGVALIVERSGMESMPDVDVDGERILQVLANLLNNALKYTEAGGSVNVRATADAEQVTMSISDTGAGIAPAELPHVFDRYWHGDRRTKIRSTGLGLAIARGIIQAHGGRIWAESTLGRGSTFAFGVPIAIRDRDDER